MTESLDQQEVATFAKSAARRKTVAFRTGPHRAAFLPAGPRSPSAQGGGSAPGFWSQPRIFQRSSVSLTVARLTSNSYSGKSCRERDEALLIGAIEATHFDKPQEESPEMFANTRARTQHRGPTWKRYQSASSISSKCRWSIATA